MDTTFQPQWWTEDKHGSAWSRVKEAMKRDWEQTKNDLHMGGKDLDQDVDDTVKQAAGKQAIPPRVVPNAPKPPSGSSTMSGSTTTSGSTTWDDVEEPMRYGYGARMQYGDRYPQWNDELEGTLRTEWETGSKGRVGRKWDEVKSFVRRGFDGK